MNLNIDQTLHLEENLSDGTALLLLFCISQ